MNGKGSNARPMSVSREEYARRWDEVFGVRLLDCEATTVRHSKPWPTGQLAAAEKLYRATRPSNDSPRPERRPRRARASRDRR